MSVGAIEGERGDFEEAGAKTEDGVGSIGGLILGVDRDGEGNGVAYVDRRSGRTNLKIGGRNSRGKSEEEEREDDDGEQMFHDGWQQVTLGI